MLYITVLGWFFAALNNFCQFGVGKQLLWWISAQPRVFQKLCQKFLSDPQKNPKSSEISDTEGFFGPQILDKILLSEPPRDQNGSKNSRRCLKKLFNINFHCSDNFEWCRNFCGSRLLFENVDLWIKSFQKWPYLQNGKKSSFFNIWWFFLSFLSNWVKLPTFS